ADPRDLHSFPTRRSSDLGFDGADVLLAGGERIQPEAVIVATGWLRALEPLVGRYGVLGHKGRPVVHGPDTHPNAPRMYFIGYTRSEEHTSELQSQSNLVC